MLPAIIKFLAFEFFYIHCHCLLGNIRGGLGVVFLSSFWYFLGLKIRRGEEDTAIMGYSHP